MSILQQSPTKYTITQEQIKELIAADLGVSSGNVEMKLIMRQGPLVDSIRGERGADILDRIEVTVTK